MEKKTDGRLILQFIDNQNNILRRVVVPHDQVRALESPGYVVFGTLPELEIRIAEAVKQ
jgi:hypothetical protein